MQVAPVNEETMSGFAHLIVEASADPAFYNNQIPKAATPECAIAWFRKSKWVIWLISGGGAPIGYLSLHTPSLTEDAERFLGFLETDSYLLPPYRGKRLMTAAWDVVLATMPEGTLLVAEIWENNTSSQKRLEREGWQLAGTYWWQHPNQPDVNGACLRYTYTVAARADI